MIKVHRGPVHDSKDVYGGCHYLLGICDHVTPNNGSYRHVETLFELLRLRIVYFFCLSMWTVVD